MKSEQRWANLEDEGYQSLLQVAGIDEGLADQFFSKDIRSAADLAHVAVEDLTIIRAIDDDFAQQLIDAAAVIAEQLGIAYEKPEPIEEEEVVEAVSSEDGESAADEAADEIGDEAVDPDEEPSLEADEPIEVAVDAAETGAGDEAGQEPHEENEDKP